MKLLARPGVGLGLALGVSFWAIGGLLWSAQSTPPLAAIAQAVPVSADSTNSYWAGYVSSNHGPYTEVQASWAIPVTSCSRRNPTTSTAYAWIGEGGYLRGLLSPLIQAGTASDCDAGVPRYHAFYEWYPGIYATDFPITVQAGDMVTVRIREDRPDYWVLSIQDDATDARSTTATFYHVDTGTADFIVERPTVCASFGCDQIPLARFGVVTFQQVRTRDAGGATSTNLQSATPIALTTGNGEEDLAVPARAKSLPDALSILWRHSS